MPRIGVVLGAGGVVGHAFHAGVLHALGESTGWDPRDADVIVGTSAGSVVGALLRAGFAASDLAARAWGEPLSADGARLAARSEAGTPAPIPSSPRRGRRYAMSSPALLARTALQPWRARPGVVAAAFLPEGRVPAELVAAGLRPLFGDGWPDRALWINAVRLDDGRRVVFGRDHDARADVATAVGASCAIPGFFAPVTIDGVRHIDGGAHSPTNADVVARLGLDLVIVSSPMSIAGRSVRIAPDQPARRLARLALAGEVARLRRRGTPVLAFQPTDADTASMGLNAMDPTRRAPVARQAYESTRRRLERVDVHDRLALLTRAPRA